MTDTPIGSKQVLLGLSLNQLEEWAVAQGQPAFRGRQLHEWLYEKGARSLEAITVLPKVWRKELLETGVTVGRLDLAKRSVAEDATVKLLLSTNDGQTLETVGIPTSQRLTVCVSSQVGCPMACSFCATGKEGLQRSLFAHEIVDQVLSVREFMGRRPSHVVFMGMGEPLLNIEEVLVAVRCLNRDVGIGQRRITLSTVGVANTLPKLAQLALKKLASVQFTLAVSLHAPNQGLREMLIPTAKSYSLEELLDDCRNYVVITGRRITFEYILLGMMNDHPEHAEELADLVGGFQSHVNLIAYNPVEGVDYERPSRVRIDAFRRVLERRGLPVTVRLSRGLDQNAACGQLRRQHVARR